MTDPTDLDLTETDADVAFPSASPNQYDDLTIDDDGDEEEGDEIGRTVRTRSADPEITSLFDKHKRGRLVAQPEFQRMYVWDRSKASRLIESALLDIPHDPVRREWWYGQVVCGRDHRVGLACARALARLPADTEDVSAAVH